MLENGVNIGLVPGAAASWRRSAVQLFGGMLRSLGFTAVDRIETSVLRALQSIQQGFCIYDREHRLIFANQGFCTIYGQRMEALPFGIPFRDVLKDSAEVGNYPGRTAEDVWAERKAFIDKREVGTFLQSLGDGRLISISHQPLQDGGWSALYEDITERRRAETHLRFMAHHDALTMLPNRFFFGEQLESAVGSLCPGHTCAVLCLDLDGFKPVNDRLGHAAGDELLRQLADRLRGELRPSDTAARLGGDEFAVLMPGAGQAEAALAALRIRRAIGRPYDLGTGQEVRVGASVGMACAPMDGMTSTVLLSQADAALYEAKRHRAIQARCM